MQRGNKLLLFKNEFPEFHLEDKVAIWGAGNDRPPIVKVYSRRDKNRKKKELLRVSW